MNGRGKIEWGAGLLLAASFIVFLGVAEWVCRSRADRLLERRVTNVKKTGWMYTLDRERPIYYLNPEDRLFSPWNDDELIGRINAQGFRGDDFTLQKKAGVRRIACLGDSFTFGHGVRQEDAYPSQMEAILNAAAGVKAFEVLNFGVGGYNTKQEAILLEEKVLPYDPDLVILQYMFNDTEHARIRLSGTRYAVHSDAEIVNFEEEPIPMSIPLPRRPNLVLMRHSHFYRWLSKKVYLLRMRFFPQAGIGNYMSGRERCVESIARIKDLCDRSGVRLLFLVFAPATKDFQNQDRDDNHQWIRMVTSEIDLDTIDFFEIFRNYNIGTIQNSYQGKLDRSGHYSIFGNKVVAEIVAEKILRSRRPIQGGKRGRAETGNG